ncbi:condensation domain-containing protein [Dactylosporangium sp. NPDC000244]|uniref:condensation domain-containing protein n=1 Tax=Dactylosporangium sp. NPDC000244 TaxID=3154365 RepID=UPI003324E4DE
MTAADDLRDRLARLDPQQRRALLDRIRPAPLTAAQFGIWLFEQLNPDTTAYHNPAALRLRGPLDLGVLRRTLEVVQQRHDALRLRLDEDDEGMPVQRVAPRAEVALDVVDAAGDPETAVLASVRAPFDLTAGPVWRARLVRVAPDDHILVITFHHIVSDGWSLGVVLTDFAVAYTALAAGTEPPLPPVRPGYLATVRAAAGPSGADRDRLVAFWRGYLDGAPSRVTLPADSRTPASGYAGGSVPFTLDAADTAGLRAVCRSAGTTLFAGATAVFLVCLARLSGARDLVVTTPVAGRDDAATQSLVGCFLNTVPVRVRLRPGATFRDLVATAGRSLGEALAHAALPYADIVTAAATGRGESAVSNVMVLHGNAPTAFPPLPGLRCERYRVPVAASKHDLALLLTPGADGLSGELEYKSELFTAATAARLAAAFTTAARDLTGRPDVPLDGPEDSTTGAP